MATGSSGLSLAQYYASLLILQYVGKPRAYATIEALSSTAVIAQTPVQDIVFSSAPASGSFVLNYSVLVNKVLTTYSTAAINWNDSASVIQGKIQALAPLASATVSGSIAGLDLTVTLAGVAPPGAPFVVSSNTTGVTISPLSTDVTLPLAVQDAFNLLGSDPAVGVQLDVLGKYAGVTRTGAGFNGSTITLDDADFLIFIQMAIIRNNSGSSLSQIQALLFQFFPGELLVFDYSNMQMSYLINTSLGSLSLVELFVTEGLLPKPMGVQLAAVIYAPDITSFFGFRTYSLPAHNVSPFNSYTDYTLNTPWLSYADAVII